MLRTDFDDGPPLRLGPGYGAMIVISAIVSALVSAGMMFLTPIIQQKLSLQGSAPTSAEVPSLTGLSAAAAGELLRGRGLRLVVALERSDANYKAGTVIQQSPLTGSSLEVGGEVKVVLSSGPAEVQVPNVHGMPVDEAKKTLEEAKLKAGPVRPGAGGTEGEPGSVSDTDPKAGVTVAEETEVILISVPEGILVPNLIDMTPREAVKALEEVKLKLGNKRTGYSDVRRPHVIFKQDPAAGTTAPLDTAIDVVVNAEWMKRIDVRVLEHFPFELIASAPGPQERRRIAHTSSDEDRT